MAKKYKQMKLSSASALNQVAQLRIKNRKLAQLLQEQADRHVEDNKLVSKMEA